MKKISIVIPSGGIGSRFINSEFDELKPFIKINGLTIFEHIIKSLNSRKYNINFYIIIQEKFRHHYLDDINHLETTYNVKFSYINLLTEGTTTTALFLYNQLNNEDYTLLMNCDQIIDINLDDYIDYHFLHNADGSLLTFPEGGGAKKWSFVDEENNIVKKVVAKDNISDIAVCGWYAWTKGKDFIKYAIQQIVNQDKVNGEYYLCPVYNYAIKDNKRILSYKIEKSKMHGVGTPEDLREYLKFLNENK